MREVSNAQVRALQDALVAGTRSGKLTWVQISDASERGGTERYRVMIDEFSFIADEFGLITICEVNDNTLPLEVRTDSGTGSLIVDTIRAMRRDAAALVERAIGALA